MCAERVGNKSFRLGRIEFFLGNNAFKLFLLLGFDVGKPRFIDFFRYGNRVHKLFNEVFLVAQAGTGVHGPCDAGADFRTFFGTLLLEVGLHQHQDVVNIDFNLFDKFDFKNHIVVDGFPFRFGFTAKFRMQVEILALIILKGLSAENIVSRKVVKGDKNIFQPQDRAKEPDKVLLGGFSRDGRIKREVLSLTKQLSFM